MFKLDSKSKIIVFISSIFIIFFLCLLFLCYPVHAASQQTYFPMSQDVNGKMDAFVINHIEDTYPNKYYLCYGYNYISNYVQFHYIIFDDPEQLSVSFNPNGYQFSIYGYDDKREIKIQLPQYWYWDNQDYGNTWENMNSDIYDSSISYVSNCDIIGLNGALIYLVPPIYIPDGFDPSAPNMSGLDLDSSLNTTTPPTAPTFSNSFNDTIPTWDSTAPFQSLFDIIVWGFNRVHSYFQSFYEYLFSWLGYFIQMLTYLIQKIIDAIKYIVNWLYNQFLNWLTPYLKIWSFISGLLFNEDEQLSIWDVLFSLTQFLINWLNNYWSNSFLLNFFSNLEDTYSVIQSYFEDLMSYFSKVALFFTTVVALGSNNGEFSLLTLFSSLFFPSTNQVLQIVEAQDTYGFLGAFSHLASVFGGFVADLEDLEGVYVITIPSFTIMGVVIEAQDIDFTWYLPYKATGDGIISAFLIFGYLYWLFVRFSGILRGITAPASTPSELSDEYPKGSIIQRY